MATGRRAACIVPGAVPASRVLLVGSRGWPLGSAAVAEVVRWRSQWGWKGATLVVGDSAVEQACAGVWERAGDRVEQVQDLWTAAREVDVVLAFLANLDPVVVSVMERAGEAGVPVVLHHIGPYPWPADTV